MTFLSVCGEDVKRYRENQVCFEYVSQLMKGHRERFASINAIYDGMMADLNRKIGTKVGTAVIGNSEHVDINLENSPVKPYTSVYTSERELVLSAIRRVRFKLVRAGFKVSGLNNAFRGRINLKTSVRPRRISSLRSAAIAVITALWLSRKPYEIGGKGYLRLKADFEIRASSDNP